MVSFRKVSSLDALLIQDIETLHRTKYIIVCSVNKIPIDQGPGLQSLVKVKVILTLREVVLRYDNWHLLIIFPSSFVFNRLYIHILVTFLTFHIYKIQNATFEILYLKVKVTLTLRTDCSPGPRYS